MVFLTSSFQDFASLKLNNSIQKKKYDNLANMMSYPAYSGSGGDQVHLSSQKQDVLFGTSFLGSLTNSTGDFLEQERKKAKKLRQKILNHPEASINDKSTIVQYKKAISQETKKSQRIAEKMDFGASFVTAAIGGAVFFLEKVSGTVLTTMVPVVGRFTGNMAGKLHYRMTRTQSLKDYENAVKHLALAILQEKADSTHYTFDDEGQFYQLRQLSSEIKKKISNNIVQYRNLEIVKKYKTSTEQWKIEDDQQKILDKTIAYIKQYAKKENKAEQIKNWMNVIKESSPFPFTHKKSNSGDSFNSEIVSDFSRTFVNSGSNSGSSLQSETGSDSSKGSGYGSIIGKRKKRRI